jgi:hypothetical protein
MDNYSKAILDRVEPIEDEAERNQIARVLAVIERYATGEAELEEIGGFARAVCLGLLSDAVFRADSTSLTHIKHIMWFCEWDVPRKRMNLPKKQWISQQGKLLPGGSLV